MLLPNSKYSANFHKIVIFRKIKNLKKKLIHGHDGYGQRLYYSNKLALFKKHNKVNRASVSYSYEVQVLSIDQGLTLSHMETYQVVL